MTTRSFEHPSVVTVNGYREEDIPAYRNNPLICALPHCYDDSETVSSLTLPLEFRPTDRDKPNHIRKQLIMGLRRFMVPYDRHVRLSQSIDTFLREGYVGRRPDSKEGVTISQQIYENQINGVVHRQEDAPLSVSMSGAFIGRAGMGKSVTIERTLGRNPKVLYHPKYGLYQIPYLIVEIPGNGSTTAFAQDLLLRLDELIPGATYFRDLGSRGGAEAIMRRARPIMHQHRVGMLVVEEVQNLADGKKSLSTLMKELVGTCNLLKIPTLFVGTRKAKAILSSSLHLGRRGAGFLDSWERLPPTVAKGEFDEWMDFLTELWKYQWVRKPVELDDKLIVAMYFYSQGIIDIAIKLFASAQIVAINHGIEEIGVPLIANVYEREFSTVHDFVDTLRRNDELAADEIDEIPDDLDFDALFKNLDAHILEIRSSKQLTASSDEEFKVQLIAAAGNVGIGLKSAIWAAEKVVATTNERNPLKALMLLAKFLQPVDMQKEIEKAKKPTAEKRKSRTKSGTNIPAKTVQEHIKDILALNFDERPDDYRRAVQDAHQSGTTITAKMAELGMLVDLDQIFDLA